MVFLERENQNKVSSPRMRTLVFCFQELFLEDALFCKVYVQCLFVFKYFANVLSFSFLKSIHREFQSGLAL